MFEGFLADAAAWHVTRSFPSGVPRNTEDYALLKMHVSISASQHRASQLDEPRGKRLSKRARALCKAREADDFSVCFARADDTQNRQLAVYFSRSRRSREYVVTEQFKRFSKSDDNPKTFSFSHYPQIASHVYCSEATPLDIYLRDRVTVRFHRRGASWES